MSESKTSENRMAAAEKQVRALELRKQGMGFEAIADKLGYGGPSGAYKAVMTGLQRTLQEPADELRTLELKRLDAMLEATWLHASLGKPQAIDRVLKIMERRAKLLGLDAPTSINITLKSEVERIAADNGLDPQEVMLEALSILKAGV